MPSQQNFINALFVCSAQMILKLGIGTVGPTGGILFTKGKIDALTFLHVSAGRLQNV